jgi:stage II sporulation protein AB (anti-sigma F factor)
MESKEVLNSIKLQFMSISQNIGLARVTVASFAAQLDLTLNDLEEIKVATSEAVSNSVIHGYNNQENNVITINATLYRDKLEVIIEDQGKGIENIEEAMQPAYSTDPERMGLGFMFMKSFMDDVRVESKVDKGTRVYLTKIIKDVNKNHFKAENDIG